MAEMQAGGLNTDWPELSQPETAEESAAKARARELAVAPEYMSFEEFCKTSLVQSGLRAVYQVMQQAYRYYPTSPWRQMDARTHINKAFIAGMLAHENIVSVDVGGGDGGTPPLGVYNWQKMLTRGFMAADTLPLPDLSGPPVGKPLPEAVEE